MSYHVRRTGRVQRKAKPRRQSLQKPNGMISPRVQKVGGEHFAIVCVDPAKHRSEWMMADYFGNLLIEPQTVEHQSVFFTVAVETIRQAQERHGIQDTIVEWCVVLFKSFQHFTFELIPRLHHTIVLLLSAFSLTWFEAIGSIGDSMCRHSVEQLIVESLTAS